MTWRPAKPGDTPGQMEPEVRRTEVVSVRLTKAERARLAELGGPSALRRALDPPASAQSSPGLTTAVSGRGLVAWSDGTVGQQWPASVTY